MVFSGQIIDGFSADEVREQLRERFKMPAAKAEKLVAGGARVLKREMEHAAAYRLSEALKATGLNMELKRSAVSFSGLDLKLEEKSEEDKQKEREEAREVANHRAPGDLPVVDGKMECPKCSHLQPPAQTCEACGIYIEKFLAMQAGETSEPEPPQRQSFAPESTAYARPQESWGDTLKSALKVVAPIIAVALIGWKIWSSFAPGPPSKSEVFDYYRDACYGDEPCEAFLQAQFDECYEVAEPDRMEDFSQAEMLNGFYEFSNRLNQCIVDDDGGRVFFNMDEIDAAFLEELQEG